MYVSVFLFFAIICILLLLQRRAGRGVARVAEAHREVGEQAHGQLSTRVPGTGLREV